MHSLINFVKDTPNIMVVILIAIIRQTPDDLKIAVLLDVMRSHSTSVFAMIGSLKT